MGIRRGPTAAAKLFWVATATADGRPRVRPVDGTWFEGAIYVGGSPETAWVRDLLANPNVSVHLDSTDGVVIVDGVAESGRRDLGRRRGTAGGSARRALPVAAQGRGSRGAGLDRDPRTVVAWRDFAKDPTRFRFG